jgi:hypothetical protein
MTIGNAGIHRFLARKFLRRNVRTVLTLTFAQFALMFLTFWWELARWLDGTLLDLLYDSDTHSYWNMAGLQNTQDDIIMILCCLPSGQLF